MRTCRPRCKVGVPVSFALLFFVLYKIGISENNCPPPITRHHRGTGGGRTGSRGGGGCKRYRVVYRTFFFFFFSPVSFLRNLENRRPRGTTEKTYLHRYPTVSKTVDGSYRGGGCGCGLRRSSTTTIFSVRPRRAVLTSQNIRCRRHVISNFVP